MSTTLCLCHYVFNTHRRKMTINQQNEEALYRFIWSFLHKEKCKLLRIGGIPNHIHVFVDLHSTKSMADIAKEIKRLSSLWMKQSGLFPDFEGWGKEYFGFTKSLTDKDTIIEYIKNQKNHHKIKSYEEEIEEIVKKEYGIWDESMLT